MLLEEYVADRVRASETAAHIRELELLRVIRAEGDGTRGDGTRGDGTRGGRSSDVTDQARRTGWLARRSAARARKAERASAVAPSSQATGAPAPASSGMDVVPEATAPRPDNDVRQSERELQHAAR